MFCLPVRIRAYDDSVGCSVRKAATARRAFSSTELASAVPLRVRRSLILSLPESGNRGLVRLGDSTERLGVLKQPLLVLGKRLAHVLENLLASLFLDDLLDIFIEDNVIELVHYVFPELRLGTVVRIPVVE